MAALQVAEKLQNLDLDIEGMTCTACSRRIEKNLNKVEGVKAYVDFASEKAHITAAEGVTREQLVQVIVDTGYAVGSGRSENQLMVWRLAVGAGLSLPVLVVSMIPALMFNGWELLAAALTVPVATWVAWPFHSVAIKNLRARTSTMDTLVSLGVAVSYIYGTVQVLVGGMETYFEVAAVVPTIVLFGRWLEVRTRRSATDSVRALLAAIPDTSLVRRDGQQLTIPTAQVRVGDLIVVAAGQKVSVDAVVTEGTGQLDNSLITGESVPVLASVGTAAAAGSVNVGGAIVVRATATSANSRIAQIADLVREATAQKAKISSLTDAISNVFVPSVIGIALSTLAGWWLIAADPSTGLRSAVAVLVIACPCALGIAVPVSLAVATGMGARRAVIIRHPDTLSLLNRVNRVVLDKTGTITNGQLRVSEVLSVEQMSRERALALAAAVDRSSVHPIAKAIAATDSTLVATEVTETAGTGAVGLVEGLKVSVSRQPADAYTNATKVAAVLERVGPRSVAIVAVNGVAEAVIALEDDIRPTSASAISQLKEMHIEAILLSGDQEARVAAVAQSVGITEHFSEVSPEEKLSVIGRLKAHDKGLVAMVGDGLNDVAALAASDVGIAMGSGTHATQSAAAITILDDDPESIAYAIRLGRKTWSNIKENLAWAFGYNIVLIPIAAAGLLNPMLSGTAMAFSSISVVLNAQALRARVRP